jgi:hypothetical protein
VKKWKTFFGKFASIMRDLPEFADAGLVKIAFISFFNTNSVKNRQYSPDFGLLKSPRNFTVHAT